MSIETTSPWVTSTTLLNRPDDSWQARGRPTGILIDPSLIFHISLKGSVNLYHMSMDVMSLSPWVCG